MQVSPAARAVIAMGQYRTIRRNGRWLRWDKLERDSRFIEFDFAALCERMVDLSPGATSIASYEKREGGYNKVFIFTMDNTSRIVARLPTRIAGPPGLATSSEVATIKYSAIIQNIKQLEAMDFPAYGSLYLEDADVGTAHKHALSTPGYVIGPHCGSTYWDCDAREPRNYYSTSHNRGPWLDPAAYCSALIDIGLSWLPLTDDGKPSYHGTVTEHRRLLDSGRDMASELIKDPRVQKAATPILLHHDLHKRNIYVLDEDPTVISDIIDWQSSSINPAFMYTNHVPDFASAPNEHSHSDSLSLGDNNAKLCHQAFIAG
ncbi:MAG: hypothetical protein Q9169_006615, partial [Polycauliona sp. 2 TL-2023]